MHNKTIAYINTQGQVWCGSSSKAKPGAEQLQAQLQNILRVSIYSACPFGLEKDKHAPPPPHGLSDIFTVKVMILDTRNERAPAWPVDSGISLMNWTTKPCWYKEEVFRIGW